MRALPLSGLSIAAASLAVYLAIGQDAFYGDGDFMLWLQVQGTASHPQHVLHVPIAALFHAALAPLGLDPFRIATVVSAVGVAIGVLLAHRAAVVLGLPAPRCAMLALLCATAPAVVFFATVIEAHGPFFAFAGLVWLAAARCARRPSTARGVALGASIGLAASVHTTGHLLPSVVLPFVAVAAARDRGLAGSRARGLAIATAATIAAHAAVAAAVTWLVARSMPNPAGGTLDQQWSVLWRRPGQAFGDLGSTVWNEWGRAFLPVSLLWLGGFATPGLRRHALAFAPGLAVYLGAASLLLGRFDEHGAYLLPLAFPAAWIVVILLPRSWPVAAAALGLAAGTLQVIDHDRSTRTPTAARVTDLTGGGRATFLYLRPQSLYPLLRHAPLLRRLHLADVLTADVTDAQRHAAFDAGFAELRAGGAEVLMMSSCLDALTGLRAPAHRRFVDEHLLASYTFTARRAGEMRALVIRPRSTPDPCPRDR